MKKFSLRQHAFVVLTVEWLGKFSLDVHNVHLHNPNFIFESTIR